ncbi:MAG: preprotein translocase subunit SecY [Eubacteriales bacterium]
MFKTLRNAFSLPELRKKILYVIFIIVLYRIGAAIPIPYINASMMDTIKGLGNGSILQYMSILSGTAFSRATLFALSISPYINASIIIQLLCTAIPALENMAKEEDGRNKITQITRYVTVGLRYHGLRLLHDARNYGLIINKSVFSAIVIIACYTAGSCLIMWLGEKINENGIGNGISIILFVNIVSSIPSVFGMLISYFKNGIGGIITAIVTIIIAVFMVVFIIFMTNSERRLPIQYAKRVVGRKMYGGQSSTLPLKLNMAGVMPIIFANSILALPSTIAMFFPTPKEGTFWYGFQRLFSYTSWLYAVVFMVLIVFFSYFYIAISFNPIEVSNNLKKNGGFIPGIRPGKPTADYITKVLNKVTLMGAFFLGVIAVLPLAANIISGNRISGIAFAGTSIIIVVGVALETAREIEAQMTMRHYKGFLE